VRVLTDTAVVELRSEAESGWGAVLERDGRREFVAARSIVLASGGFEWDATRMAQHLPGLGEWIGTPPENAGDGQRLAEAAGAQLDRMDQALIMGTTPFHHAGHTLGAPTGDYSLPHCIIVNRFGRRFVNEKQMNIGLAFAERDPATGAPVNLPAWRIYDAQFAGRYPHALPARGGADGLQEASSLAALAERIGIDPNALDDTVQRFNQDARRGEDPEFGRGASRWDQARGGDPDHPHHYTLGTLVQPPFYAAPFKASILGTKGGPRTDEYARVLDRNGNPIRGLLAAGNVMANPIGSRGVGAGTTLGPCLTWGYIAGQTAIPSPDRLSP
jgi:3-oxosteroid 1-dehydrogenase